MDPWKIIGWFVLIVIALYLLGMLFVVLRTIFRGHQEDRIRKKAHAGKLECQAKNCTKIAEVRTEAGFFCREDGRNRSRFAAFSFAAPLDYVVKERK